MSFGDRLTAVDHHEVVEMTAMLAGSDFLRTPVLGSALPEGFAEWHHFVILGAGRRLLINFNLTSEPSRTGQLRVAPRVIVIDHEKRWTGAIERFDESELDVSADLGTLTIGGNRMIVQLDGYQVVVDLPGQGIQGEPNSRPSADRSSSTISPLVKAGCAGCSFRNWRADGYMHRR